MTSTPNLYRFATKELAQDATLAYLLAWANPSCRNSYPDLHRLGTSLIEALFRQYNRMKAPEVTSIEIGTQVDRIDVLARINDENEKGVLLLIEDKVGSDEHSNQIERYIETAKAKYPGRCIVPVFLKTGNASHRCLPPERKCARFLRGDLLAVLQRFPNTGDTIVDNFREHLEDLERRTQAYRAKTPSEWGWWEQQGFYSALENQLPNRSGRSLEELELSWGYTANPAGGFLYFAFGGCRLSRDGHEFTLYFQIEGGVRLTARLGCWDGTKVRASVMYETLHRLEERTAESGSITVEKAGRFRGGTTAAVAEVRFGGEDGFLARTSKELVDLDATVDRLCQLPEILRQVANQLAD